MAIEIFHEMVEPNGKTVKENNLELPHKIPIRTLVEVDIPYSPHHGIRAFICEHTRDCDGSPMYALYLSSDFTSLLFVRKENYNVYRCMIHDGFSDDCLIVIRKPKA